MQVHDVTAKGIKYPDRKRRGRGVGSGLGKTGGRGHKGQRSRSGGGPRPGFEGGQMPLFRRIPKRGFSNARFRRPHFVVNIGDLAGFEAGAVIDLESIQNAGIARKGAKSLKILGEGEISHAITVKAHKFSASAKAKIEAAGGTAEVVGAAEAAE